MPTQIKLPNLGENIASGDVLTIFVHEGDTVKANDDLMEVETDKATMPIPAPQAGTITRILVGEGDTIAVGTAIMEFEPGEPASAGERTERTERTTTVSPPSPPPSSPSSPPSPPTKASPPPTRKQHEPDLKPEEQAAPVVIPSRPLPPVAEEEPDFDDSIPGDGHASAAAGPAVRRLARQLGVDLRRVRASGPGGRVTIEDVRNHVRETNEQVAAALPRGVTPPGSPNTDDFGGVRLEKMSRMRQTIARNMVESYTTIPQLTNFDDADVTDLEDLREQSKADYADRGIKLTAMSFVIKAIASSLRRHPTLNASVDMESNTIIYKEYVNIGIAVDTDRGLVVPVLRDADRKSISQIASEIDELARIVREGKFDLDMLRGGTFTVSNLGSVGGSYSTPIINPPQVAILLVGRSRMLPQVLDGKVVPRLIMPLSITYDHRLVDGAAAARFTNEVKSFLAAPGRLLLAP
ncbi:MAG: 2-oxo acid dehydrogenase subunit E2 [Pirellulales bacterium]|nr:2-oxo acid dehydrogenase subunit E2 [Pirellulales bacterium]